MAAKALPKSEIFARVAETTKLPRKQIASVPAEMSGMMGKKGPGSLTIPCIRWERNA